MQPHLVNRVVKRALPPSARAAIRRYRQRERPGLPPMLDPVVINRVAGELSASRLHNTRYQRLTTWKDTGTFRVTMHFDEGHERRVIYKRAVYSLDEIPANRGLPVRQGPPEYVIARTRGGPLDDFVPRAHWVEADDDGDVFEYVWEDLGIDYQHFLGYQESNSRSDVAPALAAMHEALRAQFSGVDVPEFLRYDLDYLTGIWGYATASLSRYAERTRDPVVRDVLAREDEIRAVLLDPAVHDGRPVAPIHADCNGTNMWVRGGADELRLKVVDWEWAGYGLPHADIVSIVRWCSQEERDEFLERYCSAAGLEDVDTQRRWLRRANMERAVLDAGFLAKQYLDPGHSQEWFRGFITGSLEQLLAETDVLATDTAGR